MKKLLKLFWKDEDGAALVEYGVALLVVIVAGAGGLVLIADDTEALFTAGAGATQVAVDEIPTP